MSYNLFLDDFRTPKDGFHILGNTDFLTLEWEVVRSYDQFVSHITKNGLPNLIAFDHDLADAHYQEENFKDGKVYMKYSENTSERTGMHCAQWLVDYCMDNKRLLPKFYVHSMNPAGRLNIQTLLDNYKKFEAENGQTNS